MDHSFYQYNFKPIYNDFTVFEENLTRLEQIRYIENPTRFYKETAYQKMVDGKLSHYYLFSKIKSNDFNKGSGYLTHGLDFYKGSFHGQMIRGLINFCNLEEKSIILDPFCGSGTTLVEANLLGFNSIGIDINPIACLNSRVKTGLLDYNLGELISKNEKFFDLSYYTPQIWRLKDFIRYLNQDIKELFYFFLYTRALSRESRFSISKQQGFKSIYYKIIKVLEKFDTLKQNLDLEFGNSKIYLNDNIIELKKIKSNSIDAIICSPPYIDLIDYIQEDIVLIKEFLNKSDIEELKLNSMGYNTKNIEYTKSLYWIKMNQFFKNVFRVLKPNKYFIIIIGDYYNMNESYEKLAIMNKFCIERILKRKIVNIKEKDNLEYVFFLKR